MSPSGKNKNEGTSRSAPLKNIWKAIELASAGDAIHVAAGNYNGQMNKLSYVFLYPEEWLQCVNNDINPYSVQVSPADTDIVYESGGGLTATSGHLAKNFP